MDNYQQVLLQMEEFGVQLRDKDRDLRFDQPKRRTFGQGGKWWCRLYLFRPDAGGSYIVGSFGSYKSGDWQKVRVNWQPLSDAERARMAAERAAARAKAQAERQADAALAALNAIDLLDRASRTGHSPYLERKQVQPESCRFLPDGTVVLPLMRYDLPREQRLQAVQRILPNGQKFFTKGFDKPGCCVRLGNIDRETTPLKLFCEGYATGLSLRMATDYRYPVFVALDAGNLAHVVPLIHDLYPYSRGLICADDDWLTTDHAGQLVNPGRTSARNVARKVEGCDHLWPIFKAATRQPKDTDWNDLHVREGLQAVTRQLRGVVQVMVRRYG